MKQLFYIIVALLFWGCGKNSKTIESLDVVGEYQTYEGAPHRELAGGETEKFEAIVSYDDDHWEKKTSDATWSTNLICPTESNSGSSGNAIATVAADGTVTAVNGGTVFIVAIISPFTACFELTVSGPALTSIEVTPTNPSIVDGTTQQFVATGIYADNSTRDITTSVTWSSSDIAIGTVSNSGSPGLATGVNAGTTTITATLGTKSGNTTLTVTAATLLSIAVTPTIPSIPLGLTKQFAATGTYSDNSTQDLTNTVTWTSSAMGVATINVTGLATSASVGSSTITATLGPLSDSTTLTVTAATLSSIAVTPANPSIALGLDRQFTATGTYTDATQQDLTASVVWTSADTAVASISNVVPDNGKAHSLSVGTSMITATSGSVTGATTLTVTAATLVSIDVTPNAPSIAKGLTQQFVATGTYTDSSTQVITTSVTWSTSAGGVATVSNAGGSQGLATSVAVGTTTITATLGAVSGNEDLTVTAAVLQSISVTPVNSSIPRTTTKQYTATGTYSDTSTANITTSVTWTSSSPANATISNAGGSEGLATGVAIGFVRFTATLGGVSGGANATVTP